MSKLLAKHGRDHRIGGSDPIPDPEWIYVGTYPSDPNTTSDSPPFRNSWANLGGDYPPLRFKKDIAGFVHLEGAISGGADGTVVFTLPSGYTPARSLRFLGALSDGSDFLTLQVDPTGDVIVVASGYAPADGSIPVGKISTAGATNGDVLQVISGAAAWGPDPGGTATITIEHDATSAGAESKINFTEASVISITATDNPSNGRVDVQIGITGGSNGQVLTTNSSGAAVWANLPNSTELVVEHTGTHIGTEPGLNFLDDGVVTVTATDDSANGVVKIQVGITPASTNGYVLTTSGGSVVWAAPSGGGGGSLAIEHNGTAVATEANLNFADTTLITFTVADNPTNSRVDVQAAIAPGSDGQVLTTTGTTVGWAPPAAPKKHLVLTWFSDALPTSTPAFSQVLRVPYDNGTSLTFNLDSLMLRCETPGTTSTSITLQKSPGGGAFTPTTIGSASIASGVHEDDVTSSLGTVTSGDLVRVEFTAVGTGAASYNVEMEATEA